MNMDKLEVNLAIKPKTGVRPVFLYLRNKSEKKCIDKFINQSIYNI